MTTSALPPERGSSGERGRNAKGSRIAAARARAETAKAVVLAAAVIAFFASVLAERVAASAASNQSTPASTSLPTDDSGVFEPGGIMPTQGQPSTSTGTS